MKICEIDFVGKVNVFWLFDITRLKDELKCEQVRVISVNVCDTEHRMIVVRQFVTMQNFAEGCHAIGLCYSSSS